MRSSTDRLGACLRPTRRKASDSPILARLLASKLGSLRHDTLEIVWHDLDESRKILVPVVQDALSNAALRVLEVPREEVTDQYHVFAAFQHLQAHHVKIAGGTEAPPHVQNEYHPAAH